MEYFKTMFDIADYALEIPFCEMFTLHKMLSVSTGAVADSMS